MWLAQEMSEHGYAVALLRGDSSPDQINCLFDMYVGCQLTQVKTSSTSSGFLSGHFSVCRTMAMILLADDSTVCRDNQVEGAMLLFISLDFVMVKRTS